MSPELLNASRRGASTVPPMLAGAEPAEVTTATGAPPPGGATQIALTEVELFGGNVVFGNATAPLSSSNPWREGSTTSNGMPGPPPGTKPVDPGVGVPGGPQGPPPASVTTASGLLALPINSPLSKLMRICPKALIGAALDPGRATTAALLGGGAHHVHAAGGVSLVPATRTAVVAPAGSM